MNKRILERCLQIANKNNTLEKHPQYNCFAHFSFIVQNNKIVEWATNKVGEPLTYFGYSPDSKLHAETEVFRKAKGILDFNKPFECVNIRLNKKGEIKISKPCSCCHTYLDIMGCTKIYYSSPIGFMKLAF